MKKVVFLPYDFDTAMGINNEGSLVFSYNLEDIDQLSSGADVFNGQQSVFWKNLRDAFPDELKAMYQKLRSEGKLSYEKVEQMFEEHQGKWPEAIFNEDAYIKYLQPLIENGSGAYLSMLQGSKAEQRKWWLYNRFRYIDSKYNAGDALTDVIQLRGYAKADVTVTPYADIYPAVKYGSYLVSTRGARLVSTTLECPLDKVNDTEIYIYSASQLASIGDISGLMVGFADLSMAIRLQSLKIGDAGESYSNGNLTELTLGNNTLLQTIDVRNCPNLTQSIDLSGCTGVESIYFDGTAITGCTFPNGGRIKTLHLPATIANLTIRNHPQLSEFSMPSFSQITTLRLENVGSAVNPYNILKQIKSGSRVRIIGLNLTVTSTEEVDEFYDLLDTMRGLDEYGNNVDKPQVMGTIKGLGGVTGSWLAEKQASYPSITIEAEHITSYLYYYNYDGSQLIYKETINDGGNGAYTGRPERASTAANTFTFVGWSCYTNQSTADADALKNVTADRKVYAAYSATGRTYTVYFYNGSTLLQTVYNVPYGGTATYTGETPVDSSGDLGDFEAWVPSNTNIQGQTSCYAQFASMVEVAEISDSWDTILAAVKAGTYRSKYKVGMYKPLDLGTEGTVNMQIIGFDKDSDESGAKVPVTWLSKELLTTSHRMNPEAVSNYSYQEGNGWSGYSYATSSSNDFYVQYCVLKASEEATWKLEFSAATAFDIQVPSASISYAGSTSYLAGDHEYEVTVNGTVIYKNIGGTVSVATGTKMSFEAGDSVNVMLRFKQDSKATTGSYRFVNSYLRFTDSSDAKISLATAVSGSNSSSWAQKATITISRNQIRYFVSYQEAPGSVGGWEMSEMRTYLKETIKPKIPETVGAAIKPVTKTQPAYNTTGSSFTQTTTDDVWIPSYSEMFNGLYKALFSDNSSRVKYKVGATSASWWWLRSANSSYAFGGVLSYGNGSGNSAYGSYGVALGFCT